MAVMTIAEIEATLQKTFPEALVHVEIVDLGTDSIVVRLPYKTEYLRPGGTISGPTMMTLADAAAFYLVLAMNGPLTHAVTSHLDIHFLRKPAATPLIARARVLSDSMRTAIVDVEMMNEGSSSLVARSTVTYAIPRRRAEG